MELAIIFSDWHIHDYRQFNKDGVRLKNCIKVIYDIADYATKNGIKYILFGGDWYDQQKEIPTKVINESIAAMKDIEASYPHLVFIAISGNHDYATKNLWHSPAVTALQHIDSICSNFHLIDNDYFVSDSGCIIAGIPYYELVEDFNEALNSMSIKVVNSMEDGEKCNTLLMIHQTPKGIGNAMIRPDTDPMDEKYCVFDYVYCGHIHKRQDLTEKFTVIGSPIHRDLGDVGETKGFLVTNLENPSKGYKFVELKGYPHFVQITEGEHIDTEDELYIVEKPDVTQLVKASSVNVDRFNTGLTPEKLLANYWEEVDGKNKDRLSVGLSFLNKI